MFLLLACSVAAGHYAILYAGSNQWANYRHQADVCTMYQKLLEGGYKRSDIFIMCYDDIAYSATNPYKGYMFHTREHDFNVYPGKNEIDVVGEDMTAANFYKAIEDVPTTKDDYLFIYYSDHGGPGVLGVPEGCGEYMTPADLDAALNKIAGKYKKALFAIEACYAGATAELLTAKDMAIITATNGEEVSNVACRDAQFRIYLSNEFTANMLDWIDTTENVGYLYDNVASDTETHVMYYGDESVKEISMSIFFGKGNTVRREKAKRVDVIPQKMATMMTLESMKSDGLTEEIRQQARHELLVTQALSEKLEIVLDKLIREMGASDDVRLTTSIRVDAGYIEALGIFVKRFGRVNPDDYGRFMIVKNLCAKFGHNRVLEAIEKLI